MLTRKKGNTTAGKSATTKNVNIINTAAAANSPATIPLMREMRPTEVIRNQMNQLLDAAKWSELDVQAKLYTVELLLDIRDLLQDK